ncbi:hypothetical protein FOMPIDRAFT_83684 [Fomitopsis schrenkii]|uniref:CHAT domain-containing protein n=1 Tax=Fomitopsis schrenkii TaxID=2126942 RepID=S8FYU5_FOMSC|nr:hypothetical protein FOMPIDRAFT_83684 [Fomitopsis schrenkii]
MDGSGDYLDMLRLLPPGHPLRPQLLGMLDQVSIPFEQLANRADLDEAIALHREALELYPTGHANRRGSLNQLAIGLHTRFERLGNRSDLDEAIALQRKSLALCPPGHPHRSGSLNNLANSLHTLFEQLGERRGLDEAIALQREGLELRPPGHPHHAMSLNNLAVGLSARHEHFGDRKDLDEAIALQRRVLELRPAGHPNRAAPVNNLAVGLYTRFKQLGDRKDLDAAIVLQREALELYPSGHPGRAMWLNNLANGLLTRFDQLGDRADLNEAIALQSAAVDFCQPGHPNRAMSVNNLARGLHTRFEQLGDRADLNDAVALNREAVAILPSGHPNSVTSLNNLVVDLYTRFEHFNDRADLEEAITLQRKALRLCPAGHPDRAMSVNNFAHGLHARFELLGNPADLNEAIALRREALELRPAGHPDRVGSLNYLAYGLSTRFERLGDRADLDEAVALEREALDLHPGSQPTRVVSLNNLANCLYDRSERFGDRKDLDEAIKLYEACIEGNGDVWQSKRMLAAIKSQPRSPYYDPEASLQILSDLLDGPLGSAQVLLQRALSTLQTLSTDSPPEQVPRKQIVKVYQQAVNLMPRAAYLGQGLTKRLQSIADAEPAATMAASHALLLPEPDVSLAVELLEQGRAVFWRQSLSLRTPLDSISIPDDLRNRIVQLSWLLDSQPAHQGFRDKATMEKEDATRFRQSQELDQLVQEVRKGDSEEHKHFLLPDVYDTLAKAANKGPLVILLSTVVTSGAIVIRPGGGNDWVPLPSATPSWLRDWNESWQGQVGDARAYLRESRDDEHAQPQRAATLRKFVQSEHTLLEQLWDNIVEPIVDVLKALPGGKRVNTGFGGVPLQELPGAAILHLASHGVQDDMDPLQSGFLMADQKLTIQDLMNLNLPNAYLAILTTMLFVGFKSVVATMWQMQDSMGKDIAEKMYSQLFADPTQQLDPGLIASALHKAIGEICKPSGGEAPLPSTWAPFIHIGA